MAEGPIPFSAIDRYAERYGLVVTDEFDRFLTIVSGLDREFLSGRAEQARKAKELQEKIDKEQAGDPPRPKPKPKPLKR